MIRLELDRELAVLYARALITIARVDGEIGLEESLRLQERIEARCTETPALEDLLLEPRLDPEALAAAVAGGPFRGASIHPLQLAQMLVEDGRAVVLAKGHATFGEANTIRRFATALGMPDDEALRRTR